MVEFLGGHSTHPFWPSLLCGLFCELSCELLCGLLCEFPCELLCELSWELRRPGVVEGPSQGFPGFKNI